MKTFVCTILGLGLGLVSGDPTVTSWNKAATDGIVASNIRSNVSLIIWKCSLEQPLSSLTKFFCFLIDTQLGVRVLAILNTAQYNAIQETLKAEGLTAEKVRADPKAVEKATPSLQAAVASAGEVISKFPYIACGSFFYLLNLSILPYSLLNCLTLFCLTGIPGKMVLLELLPIANVSINALYETQVFVRADVP